MDTTLSRVKLQIDLDILRENFHKIADLSKPLGTVVVLKANAYGMGMRKFAEVLVAEGAAGIATASWMEASMVMDLGVPVLVLGTLLPEELEPALRAGLRMPLPSFEAAKQISELAGQLGVVARCHLPIDTGMSRVGIHLADACEEVQKIAQLPHLVLEGIYSHFPTAEIENDPATFEQIQNYLSMIEQLRAKGIEIPCRHLANSDGINNYSDLVCRPPFTHVRAGIGLFGSFDAMSNRHLKLRPVFEMRAKLAQIRTIPAGHTVGYGRTFRCPTAMRVGTVAAGYGDGLPLMLTNRGSLLIRGKACPIVGRLAMDYTTVDLSQVPDAQVGDDVICVGGERPGAMTVEQWAKLKSTHAWDILVAMSSRVERVYVEQGK